MAARAEGFAKVRAAAVAIVSQRHCSCKPIGQAKVETLT